MLITRNEAIRRHVERMTDEELYVALINLSEEDLDSIGLRRYACPIPMQELFKYLGESISELHEKGHVTNIMFGHFDPINDDMALVLYDTSTFKGMPYHAFSILSTTMKELMDYIHYNKTDIANRLCELSFTELIVDIELETLINSDHRRKFRV